MLADERGLDLPGTIRVNRLLAVFLRDRFAAGSLALPRGGVSRRGVSCCCVSRRFVSRGVLGGCLAAGVGSAGLCLRCWDRGSLRWLRGQSRRIGLRNGGAARDK